MSDLREQLLKAGLVSPKQARQAKHEERVHRKEAGPEALAKERQAREEAHQREHEEKRRLDREREESKRRHLEEAEGTREFTRRLLAGWIRDATGGNRRFYFEVEGGRITYFDLTEQAMRRLQTGSAAIAETRGLVRGEYCLIDAPTAQTLARSDASTIRFWNRQPER